MAGPAVRKGGPSRRGRHVELHESKAIQTLLAQLAEKGLDVAHYAAQDTPLFELIEGQGDKEARTPIVLHPRNSSRASSRSAKPGFRSSDSRAWAR